MLWIGFEYTSWGRGCFATGGHAQAARLAGVRVDRITVQNFVLAGLIAGLAGTMAAANLGSADPTIGLNFLLPAFAGVFLGATAIRPGRYNSVGTVLAVYLLAVGITGLQQVGASFYVEQYFYGGALLLAVTLAQYAGRRKRSVSGR